MENYTAKDIAELLDCNEMVIRRRLHSGEIKGKNNGQRWLVSKENLLEYTKGIEHPIVLSKFAKMVRRCDKTIRDKAINGEIRGVKIGGKWYIDKYEIGKFV